MKQMEIMNSSCKSESNDLKSGIIGYKNSDKLAISVEKKKQLSPLELKKKKSKLLKKDDPLNGGPSIVNIVNSNHFDSKKRKSKSNVFSPETRDKKSQNVNKRLKKENLPSEIVEVNVQNIELSTPTFNLTSTPKPHHSVGRKINVDISDPIFKLPFELGWKRELVYRKNDGFTKKHSDVYYYSPNNQKLRSFREIQEHLNSSISDDNLLTIDSFTFTKQPVGINDPSKELIRDANSKLYKKYSFSGNVNKSKKSKIPVQQEHHELSDNNKSSNKVKIVSRNTKKGSKSKSIKDKGSSETMNISITPDYVTEDRKAIQSTSAVPPAEPLKFEEPAQINAIDKTNAEINGSVRNRFELISAMQKFSYTANVMKYIFKYLKVHELVVASQVCEAWRLVAMQNELWQNVSLKNSMVYDWNKFVDAINEKNTVSLDTRFMLIPKNNVDSFWLCFSKDLKRAVKLKSIELYKCPPHVIEDIIHSLSQLEVLNASTIKNSSLAKDTKDFITLSLRCLSSVQNLTEIRLKSLSGIKLTELPTFVNLTNLRTLSLTSIKSFPKDTCQALDSVTSNLEHLAIGDCKVLFKDFAGSLRKFSNLKSLRLENCCDNWNLFAQETFCAIRSLNKLGILELINIEFTDTIQEELEKCCGIRSLLIIPTYLKQSAHTFSNLLECLDKLAPTLTHFMWGLTNELLRVTNQFISHFQNSVHFFGCHPEQNGAGQESYNIPILRRRNLQQQLEETDSAPENDQMSNNIDIMPFFAFKTLLEAMMVCTETKLFRVEFSSTTKIHLSDHFNDL